jgi:hypothetical protein
MELENIGFMNKNCWKKKIWGIIIPRVCAGSYGVRPFRNYYGLRTRTTHSFSCELTCVQKSFSKNFMLWFGTRTRIRLRSRSRLSTVTRDWTWGEQGRGRPLVLVLDSNNRNMSIPCTRTVVLFERAPHTRSARVKSSIFYVGRWRRRRREEEAAAA